MRWRPDNAGQGGTGIALCLLALSLLGCARTVTDHAFYSDGTRKMLSTYYFDDRRAMPLWDHAERWPALLSAKLVHNRVLHGKVLTWYPSGTPRARGEFRHDLREGRFTRWYPNGQKAYEEHYREDVRHGRASAWLPDGRLIARGYYRNGMPYKGSFLTREPGGDRYTRVDSYADGDRVGTRAAPVMDAFDQLM